MTDTTDLLPGVATQDAEAPGATTSKSSGLAGLKLAQLQALAGQLGITGGSRMRKSDLVSAISDHQRGGAVADRQKTPSVRTERAAEAARPAADVPTAGTPEVQDEQAAPAERQPRTRNRNRRAASDGIVSAPATDAPAAAPAAAEQSDAGSRENADDAAAGEQ